MVDDSVGKNLNVEFGWEFMERDGGIPFLVQGYNPLRGCFLDTPSACLDSFYVLVDLRSATGE